MDDWVFFAIIYVASAVVWGVIWGIATNKVIENKGYYENWFWWGFLFGFIAFIVAITKPYNSNQTRNYSGTGSGLLKKLEAEKNNMEIGEVKNGSWKCICGEVNPQYLTTCTCGKTYVEVIGIVRMNEESEEQSKTVAALDQMKKYKELLDIGAITEEEFETKKKELLNI